MGIERRAENLAVGRRGTTAHSRRITGEIVIQRPVEEVFEVVADERNDPRYNPRLVHVEKLSTAKA